MSLDAKLGALVLYAIGTQVRTLIQILCTYEHEILNGKIACNFNGPKNKLSLDLCIKTYTYYKECRIFARSIMQAGFLVTFSLASLNIYAQYNKF